MGKIAGSGQNFQHIIQLVHFSFMIMGLMERQDAVLLYFMLPREAGIGGISLAVRVLIQLPCDHSLLFGFKKHQSPAGCHTGSHISGIERPG